MTVTEMEMMSEKQAMRTEFWLGQIAIQLAKHAEIAEQMFGFMKEHCGRKEDSNG